MIICTKSCMNLTKKAEKKVLLAYQIFAYRDSKEIPVLEKDGKVYSTDFSKAMY